MSETVTIYVDENPIEVPQGENLVDAAKRHGINIPVFCYHPKMEPVGMCRMCLVELGMEQRDRETGELQRDEEDNPVIRWYPTLQTACTLQTGAGMHIRTLTDMAKRGRRDIIEFLLTSHPLDCPVCDKGGECPLQELTMRYGPGKSRFLFDEKMDLAKHVPLGDQIFLDRERCIQCARCVRYCEEIVDDPVLAFFERGRRLQIVTTSEPGFDSKFSGNTTDICPVGALTTADFRFGARPWELENIPSICTHCPVGCNLTLCTRLDRDRGEGQHIIKRVMPRQNEQVNEIWICDKGRFGHHYTIAPERIHTPVMHGGGTTWDKALETLQAKLQDAGRAVAALAGPTLANEDLWMLRRLVEQGGSEALGTWPAHMTGGDLIAEVGLAHGSNFNDMGEGTCIVVVASDLEEEAPIWWHRVKTAMDRGAALVTVSARATKLGRCAAHRIGYAYGGEVDALNGLIKSAMNFQNDLDIGDFKAALGEIEPDDPDAGAAVAEADNLVVIVGGEGLDRAGHAALMRAAANLLIATGHTGRPNNGLLAVWPGANFQGALDIGYAPEATETILEAIGKYKLLVIADADPAGEDAKARAALEAFKEAGGFLVVTALFENATTALADLVLPRLSFAERDGTFTNGERRVQRFYHAIEPRGEARAEWRVLDALVAEMEARQAHYSAASVMQEIVRNVPHYGEMSYPHLMHVEPQFPKVGGDDLYYGGTTYKNEGGLGVQWPAVAEEADYAPRLTMPSPTSRPEPADGELLVVPVRLLYDRGARFHKTGLVRARIPEPHVVLSEPDAARLGIQAGDRVRVEVEGGGAVVSARVGDAPEGAALLPLDLGSGESRWTAARVPAAGTVSKVE